MGLRKAYYCFRCGKESLVPLKNSHYLSGRQCSQDGCAGEVRWCTWPQFMMGRVRRGKRCIGATGNTAALIRLLETGQN